MKFKINKYDKSAEIYERAKKVIPAGLYGHQGPAEACFIPTTAYPFFSDHAKGAYFWDVDGNRFIDYMNAYGPNVLGYCDDDVDNAAFKQAKIENTVTVPSPKIVEFAELLVDTVNCADWAFFAKNGSDVTSLAITTARAHTHRKKIILVDGYYHGKDPWCQKIDYPGIIPEDVENVLYVKWNDYDSLERLVHDNKDQIAAFMSTPYMHGNFVDNELPASGYWQKVRDLCTREGIVLIIDDVRTGFRFDLRGSDYYYGFKADLICFCKALANGWPVSALCGQEQFRNTVSGIQATGSYWLSAVPFAAGIACINKLKKLNAPAIYKEKATKLLNGLQKVGADNGFNLKVTGEPAMFYLRIANDDNLMLHQKWVAECVKRGVFFTIHHSHFINTALTDDDIAYSIEVANDAFKAIKK